MAVSFSRAWDKLIDSPWYFLSIVGLLLQEQEENEFYQTTLSKNIAKAMCKPGYFGHFCNITCPSGSYGPRCGAFCVCPVEECDHLYGCLGNIETKVQTTISVTNQRTEQLQITTRDVETNSKKTIVFVTTEPMTKSGFQAVYLLVGLCAIISIFLFIIIIQLCKKSRTSKRQHVIGQTSNDNSVPNESTNQGNQRRNYDIFSEQYKDHSYRSFDIQYAEIDETLEMNNLNNSVELGEDGRQGSIDRYDSTIDGNSHTKNEDFVEDMTEESKLYINASSVYLEPIFISGLPKISKKQQ